MNRERLCVALRQLCDEFGVAEVQEALSDVVDAIQIEQEDGDDQIEELEERDL